jgi:hypothetical protein
MSSETEYDQRSNLVSRAVPKFDAGEIKHMQQQMSGEVPNPPKPLSYIDGYFEGIKFAITHAQRMLGPTHRLLVLFKSVYDSQ